MQEIVGVRRVIEAEAFDLDRDLAPPREVEHLDQLPRVPQ